MPGIEDPMSAMTPAEQAPHESQNDAPPFDEVTESKIQRAFGVSKNGNPEAAEGINLSDEASAEVDRRREDYQSGIERAVKATIAWQDAEGREKHDESWSRAVDELSEALAGLTPEEKEMVRKRAQVERGDAAR